MIALFVIGGAIVFLLCLSAAFLLGRATAPKTKVIEDPLRQPMVGEVIAPALYQSSLYHWYEQAQQLTVELVKSRMDVARLTELVAKKEKLRERYLRLLRKERARWRDVTRIVERPRVVWAMPEFRLHAVNF